jgi:hypothetical protein
MVFRNACTVQPKAWPAGGAVTVAGSELIRIPSPRGTRPIEDAHSAGGRGWVSRAVRWRWARVSHEAGCGWQRGESRFGFTRREAGRYSGTILNASDSPGRFTAPLLRPRVQPIASRAGPVRRIVIPGHRGAACASQVLPLEQRPRALQRHNQRDENDEG